MYSIKNFEPRIYQQTILNTCSKKNCLIILPTGLGKTKTAILTTIQRLNNFPNSKILFLTPTKPLANQIAEEFVKSTTIEKEKISVFTGEIKPEERERLWKESIVIVSTPQGLTNDIISKKISLEEVSCLVFDEAHRAVGDYDYVWIAKQYSQTARYPRILGLTASPGSEKEKILEVCSSLNIEEIEVRTDQDEDVKPYIKEVEIDWIKVELPQEFNEIRKLLYDSYNSRLNNLKKWGLIGPNQREVSKKQILVLQGNLQSKLARGEKEARVWSGISLAAEVLKIQHAIELLETQGIVALNIYINNLIETSKSSKVKATKNVVNDPNFSAVEIKVKKLVEDNFEHPKLEELKKLVEKEVNEKKDVKIIIFNQYRDSAVEIEKRLNLIPGVRAKLFVGQLKKRGTGLSQKEQIEILNCFKSGEYNILVTTSIAEEGLDIVSVDLVVFYEPVPSAIRSIQRRGRTGRQSKGRVIMMITKGTRDEAYHWTAFHKEKRMYRYLDELKKECVNEGKIEQPTLNNFIKKEDKIKIYADYREKGSNTLKILAENEVNLIIEKLDIADYLCSNRVAVEIKNVSDFVDSIIDGRLLGQIKDLKNNFERPLVIIEGEEDIYSIRNIHPNSIRGMLATIAISYGIPVIQTKNSRETALLLLSITKRENEEGFRDFKLQPKKPLSLKEQQEFITSSLPGIGSSLAKSLLKQFKNIKKIVNANEEELKVVEKIGSKKASEIRKVLDSNYEE